MKRDHTAALSALLFLSLVSCHPDTAADHTFDLRDDAIANLSSSKLWDFLSSTAFPNNRPTDVAFRFPDNETTTIRFRDPKAGNDVCLSVYHVTAENYVVNDEVLDQDALIQHFDRYRRAAALSGSIPLVAIIADPKPSMKRIAHFLRLSADSDITTYFALIP